MKKALGIIVTIAMLVTMFSTVVNFGSTSAASKSHPKTVARHHRHPSKPVKSPKPSKCVIPTPSVTETFMISAGTVDSKPGGEICFPVNFTYVPANGISATDMTVSYDPTQLEYIGANAGSIVPNPDTNFAVAEQSPGVLKLLFIDYTSLYEHIYTDGVFVNLSFRVHSSVTIRTSINIHDITVGDGNLVNVPTTAVEGLVSIFESTPTLPRISPYTPTPTPTPTPTTPTPTPPVPMSTLEVTVGSIETSPNESITLPINFKNTPAIGIATCNITITYDPTQLEFLSYEPGSIVPNPDMNFIVNKDYDGFLKLLFLDYTFGSEYIKLDGLIANLNFKVLGSPGSSTPINLSNATVGDLNLYTVGTTLFGGLVTVSAPNSETDFCFKVGSADVNTGDIITIPVTFANVPDKGIAVCDMTITYDTTKLEYVAHETGSIVNNPDMNYEINKLYDGAIKILFLDNTMRDEYITSNGLFTNLTFKVLDSFAGLSCINVEGSTFGDIDLTPINAAIVPGYINISDSSEHDQP